MAQIRLVSWDPGSARERARALKKAGFTVHASPPRRQRIDQASFAINPPAVLVIDLDRLPSHGRAVAIVVHSGKSTGHIPIVFAGGEEAKVKPAREQAPWAHFADWPGSGRRVEEGAPEAGRSSAGKAVHAALRPDPAWSGS